MGRNDKPLVWLHGEIKTPPMSRQARLEAGFLLRQLQQDVSLSLPLSRPMPDIGARCHELRVSDGDVEWRIFYRTDVDAVVLIDVLKKKSRRTPKKTLETCRRRLAAYDEAAEGRKDG